MVLIAMLAMLNALLLPLASNTVLSLAQQRQIKRRPTGLQPNTGGAES